MHRLCVMMKAAPVATFVVAQAEFLGGFNCEVRHQRSVGVVQVP